MLSVAEQSYRERTLTFEIDSLYVLFGCKTGCNVLRVVLIPFTSDLLVAGFVFSALDVALAG